MACGAIRVARGERERIFGPHGKGFQEFAQLRRGVAMVAIKLAHDLDHGLHRLKVSIPHRGIGDDQRFVQAADLQRRIFGWGGRRTPVQNVLHDLARRAIA